MEERIKTKKNVEIKGAFGFLGSVLVLIAVLAGCEFLLEYYR